MGGGFPVVWAKAAEPAGLLCLGTTISQREGREHPAQDSVRPLPAIHAQYTFLCLLSANRLYWQESSNLGRSHFH